MKINDMNTGVRAMVINTNYHPNPFRLLVINQQSGAESKIKIDGDTTFLDFGGTGAVQPRNLEVLFEGVPITNTENKLSDVLSGVTLNIKGEAPGTTVKISVAPDIDQTLEAIREFVTKYNDVSNFIHSQQQIDPRTQRAGLLSSESSLRTVLRGLQSTFAGTENSGTKFNNLASIGITTDPKTGSLVMDEAKVRQNLAEDYDSVAELFIRSDRSRGIADQLGEKLRGYRDPNGGMVRSRLRSIDTIIRNADRDLEHKERQLQQREQAIRQRFNALETRMADLHSQGNYIAQRFGGGQ
jgi:flagellar hook-associated protein 2